MRFDERRTRKTFKKGSKGDGKMLISITFTLKPAKKVSNTCSRQS